MFFELREFLVMRRKKRPRAAFRIPMQMLVKIPVLMVQVHDDAWTRNPADAQKTFDLLGIKEKELLWIRDTPYRFKDGYNYFGRHPEKMLPFIDRFMK